MTEPLVERRRRLLRDEIGRIAVGIFAERGFDHVTVADIAVAAGISERTFFRYFASKDEVVLDYERLVRDRLVDAITARPAGEGAVTALREAYMQTSHVEPEARVRVVQLARILTDAPALRARAHGERRDRDDVLVAEVTRRLRKRGGAMHARVVVTAMDAVAAAEFHEWAQSGGVDDPADRIGVALKLLEDGLIHLDM
ncbi:TetR family transcriptional regulator [Mycolicibacterium boenickei]|nr:TetR family transcriptional regulator [Mycolicibacterium boenickei]